MHAIDTPGAVDGRFSAGNPNPEMGQRPTHVSADWLNDIQGNLLHLMERADVAPTKGRKEDLFDAMRILFSGGGHACSGPNVPSGRKLEGAGLLKVSGEGDLSQDRTLTVASASAQEITEGEVDDKAITPLGLAQVAHATLEQEGHAVMPGGLIIQWGQLRGPYQQGTVYKGFPVSFPNACLAVTATAVNASSSSLKDMWAQIASRDQDGFSLYFQLNAGGASINTIDGVDFIAIGH